MWLNNKTKNYDPYVFVDAAEKLKKNNPDLYEAIVKLVEETKAK